MLLCDPRLHMHMCVCVCVRGWVLYSIVRLDVEDCGKVLHHPPPPLTCISDAYMRAKHTHTNVGGFEVRLGFVGWGCCPQTPIEFWLLVVVVVVVQCCSRSL